MLFLYRFFFVILFFLTGNAYAQSDAPVTTYPGQVDLDASHHEWSLSNTEWLKYKELMKGEAGLFYKNASPQYVLSIYETDAVKKRQYAKESLEQYYRRHKQTTEIFKIQQDLLVADFGHVRSTKKKKNSPWWKNIGSKRRVLFLTEDCAECDAVAKELIKTNGKTDFYFVGAEDDTAIRRWATNLEIPVDKISKKQITLNHGNALALRLYVSEYPSAFTFDGENYNPVIEQ